jgi:phage terminase large subunit
MITTRVFSKTLKAYNDGFNIIGNRGGSRSGKTFAELQLIKKITDLSKKKRIITVVSHSLPHLEGGAIRDFDNILESDGIIVDNVRTKHPYIYTLNKNIVEFVGFDRPGKALGAARDILFINEANKMGFNVCNHLMIRTSELVLTDWNPSDDFWFDTEGFENRNDCAIIDSNFLDNFDPLTGKSNLSERQLNEFYNAKLKAEAEDKAGKRGYWWNWWQVYGLGKKGQLEGVIFQNWQEYTDLPDCDLYKLWVIDWGGLDPTTVTELNFDGENNSLYIREHIYQPQILNSKLIEFLHNNATASTPVICDSARKDKIFELQMAGITAFGATKGEGSIIDGIERLQEFDIFIHKDSKNAIFEFRNYKRVQDQLTGKYLDIPEDKNNHIIDPVRYGARFYRRSVKPL